MKNVWYAIVLLLGLFQGYSQDYTTSNTSNTNNGSWTKLCSVKISTQYGNASMHLLFAGGNTGGQGVGRGTIFFRVKQQQALGGTPFVELELESSNGRVDKEDVVALITETSTTRTTVDLYMRIRLSYEIIKFTPLLIHDIGGTTLDFFSNNGFATTLPAGTQVAGTSKNSYKTNGFFDKLAIGTSSFGSHKLTVEGSIGAREVRVNVDPWSDFVFEEDYGLPTLEEVEQHIKEKGHLKDIPSAKEVEENGIFLGEMDAKLLQKIEELTLYTIQLQKQIKELKEENARIKVLEDKLDKLLNRL